MAKQSLEELGAKGGDQIIVKGLVTYAQIDKMVEGEALAKENERRRQRGAIEAQKPFRSITISNPEVIQGQNTPLANYLAQSIYNNKQTGAPTLNFESKSPIAPSFGHIQDGKIQAIADPMQNPAQGQVVYVGVSVFVAKGFNRMGSAFESIVYGEGPIQFFERGMGLSGFGQALGLPVDTQVQGASPEVPQPNTGNSGFGQPASNPQQFNGFGGAPTEQQNQGFNTQQGFNQPEQNQNQGFGGQDQSQSVPDNQQPAPNQNPFGMKDADVLNNPGQTMGGNNTGQPGNNPFA